MELVGTTWNASAALVITRLSGRIAEEDVTFWRESLTKELARIPSGRPFKLLVDSVGYDPVDISVHKAMRSVVPAFLADYGFRTALLELADAGGPVALHQTRGIRCIAVAHVHHEATKMDELDRRLGKDNERFFADRPQAETWIDALPIGVAGRT
jgi:hypothetical protein